MNPWLETAGVAFLAVAAVLLSWWVGRRRRIFVFIVTGAALIVVALIGVSRRVEALNFTEPIMHLTAGRREFVILAFAGTMLLLTPLSLLPRRNERRLIKLLAVVAVFYFSILPFLQPAMARPRLEAIETHFDEQGVCLQSYDYTCGPAAAVTALRRLGVEAGEGELAIAAHTSPIVGTAPDLLAAALNRGFGKKGVRAEYKWFNAIDELDTRALTLVVVRGGAFVDHYVVVVHVGRDDVRIADPIDGYRTVSRDAFDQMWRGSGVTVTRQRGAIFWDEVWSWPDTLRQFLRNLRP